MKEKPVAHEIPKILANLQLPLRALILSIILNYSASHALMAILILYEGVQLKVFTSFFENQESASPKFSPS